MSFLWRVPFTDADLGVVQHVADLGYDVFEFPAPGDGSLTASKVRAALEASGIGASVIALPGPESDATAEDEAVREAAVAMLVRAVDFAAAVGSPIVLGPMARAYGRKEQATAAERRAQLDRSADVLRTAADAASRHGIRLGIEPINRFETDLVNTVGQALELCERIARDNVGVAPDVFHMSIEERDIPAALRTAGDRLAHLHVCGSDRGTPGGGHTPWDGIAEALADVGFDGIATFESWYGELEAGWAMWRPYFEDPDVAAREAVAFMRERLGGRVGSGDAGRHR